MRLRHIWEAPDGVYCYLQNVTPACPKLTRISRIHWALCGVRAVEVFPEPEIDGVLKCRECLAEREYKGDQQRYRRKKS